MNTNSHELIEFSDPVECQYADESKYRSGCQRTISRW